MLGIVGCGAIGSFIARSLSKDLSIGVFDVNEKAAEVLSSELGVEVFSSQEELLSRCSVIVESASIKAARKVLEEALPLQKKIVIMSVGVFADVEFLRKVESLAEEHNSEVYIPSGAVGALDALRSARPVLEDVKLVTTKPPSALRGAPCYREVDKKTRLFSGNALQAIKCFPRNVNVAVAVSLAGIGVERTRVEVYADPEEKLNVHEIYARGEFGRMYFRVENLPTPENPKTSYLASLSAVETVRGIFRRIRFG